MQKIAAPGNQKTPANARQLHTSQFFYICPFETPEGQQCGIVNDLGQDFFCRKKKLTAEAMTCTISCDYPSYIVIEWIRNNIVGVRSIYDSRYLHDF